MATVGPPLPKRKKYNLRRRILNSNADEYSNENEVTMSNVDYFSLLPRDCIYSIFSFLNQVDLDILAPVSGTLNTLVCRSRPKVPRSSAFHAIEFNNDTSDDDWSLDVHGQHGWVKASEIIQAPPLQTIDFMMRKYDIHTLKIYTALINKKFLKCCKRWQVMPRELWISDDVPGRLFSFVVVTFMNWLRSSGIQSIVLDGQSTTQVNSKFLKVFSTSLPNPSIEARSYVRHMDNSAMDNIHLFQKMILPEALIMDIDMLIEAIIKRLRRHISGSWVLRLFSQFQEAFEVLISEVCAQTDLSYEQDDGNHFIRIEGSEIFASFYIDSSILYIDFKGAHE